MVGEPERAAIWAARAAREATDQAAFTDAARLWRLAVDNSRRAGWPDAERAPLHVELGRSYEMLAEPSQAERAYQQAIRLAPVADRPAIRVRLAWVAFRQDRITLAKRRLTVGLQGLDGHPADEAAMATRVELVLLRAAIRDLQGDRAGSDEDARWAEAESEKLRRTDLRGEAVMQLALNADGADDPADGVEQLAASARSLLDGAGKHYELGVLDVNLGVSLMVHCRWHGLWSDSRRRGRRSRGAARCSEPCTPRSTAVASSSSRVDSTRPSTCSSRWYVGLGPRSRSASSSSPPARPPAPGRGSGGRRGDRHADAARRGARRGRPHRRGDLPALVPRRVARAGRPVSRGHRRDRRAARGRRRSTGDAAVGAALTRLAAVAGCLLGKPGGSGGAPRLARDGPELDATYEVVRALQALEALVPEPDPAWREEREQLCALLGVVRLPPVG